MKKQFVIGEGLRGAVTRVWEKPQTDKEAISELLYTIGQESEHAYKNMLLLCTLLGVTYPPEPTEKANQRPVTLEIN